MNKEKLINQLKEALHSNIPDPIAIDHLLHHKVAWKRKEYLYLNYELRDNQLTQVLVDTKEENIPLWIVLVEEDFPLFKDACKHITFTQEDKAYFEEKIGVHPELERIQHEAHKVYALKQPDLVETTLIDLFSENTIRYQLYFTNPRTVEHFLAKGLKLDGFSRELFLQNMDDNAKNGKNNSEEIIKLWDVVTRHARSHKYMEIAWKHIEIEPFLNSALNDEIKLAYIKCGLLSIPEDFNMPFRAKIPEQSLNSGFETDSKKIRLHKFMASCIMEGRFPEHKEELYKTLSNFNDLTLVGIVTGYFDRDFLVKQISSPELQHQTAYHLVDRVLPQKEEGGRKPKL